MWTSARSAFISAAEELPGDEFLHSPDDGTEISADDDLFMTNYSAMPAERTRGCGPSKAVPSAALSVLVLTLMVIASIPPRPGDNDDRISARVAHLDGGEHRSLCGGENWTLARRAVGTDERPILQVHGGPPLKRQDEWVARVCTATSGANCSHSSVWEAREVVLCLDGEFFGTASMHTRGHTSSMLPKLQFGLKLVDDVAWVSKQGRMHVDQKAAPQEFLGMPREAKWVLGVPFVDTSFVRNALSFKIYELLGAPWAPRTVAVNLVLQGEPWGLYAVTERIEPSPNRVVFDDERVREAPAVAVDAARSKRTDDYLVVVDWQKEGEFGVMLPASNTTVSVLYPSSPDESERRYVAAFLAEADRRVARHDDDVSDIVDLESFARYYVLQEVAKDADGYGLSDYLAISAGRLQHASPWDFDLAYNFDCYKGYYQDAVTGEERKYSRGWNVRNGRTFAEWIDDDGTPGRRVIQFDRNLRAFFLHLFEHAEFQAAFRAAYRSAREEGGALSDVRALVASLTEPIAASAARDIEIWSDARRFGVPGPWPACAFWECCHPADGQNATSAQAHLVEYLEDRIAWMDEAIERPL